MKMKPLVCAALLSTAVGVAQAETSPRGYSLTPEEMIQMARVGGSALSPDGKTAVYSLSRTNIADNRSYADLYLISLDGKSRVQLTQTKENESDPQWIEAGERIAYLSTSTGSAQVWTMKPDGTDRRQITDIEGGILGYRFSPDGARLMYVREVKYGQRTVDLYPDLPKASGRVTNELMYKHWDEWVETVPHIFVSSVGSDLIRTGVDLLEGEPYEAPMKPHLDLADVAWSPDGKWLAYASRKKTGMAYSLSTNSDIYLYNIERRETRNLTEGMMGYDTHPVFSPDGKSLLWVSMERDGYESDLKRLFCLDLSTGAKTYLTEGFEFDIESPTWSADGKSIYFLSCVYAETHLHELTLKSRKIRQITTGQYNYTSLDLGRGFALAGRQSIQEPTDLYRVDLKTGKPVALTSENAELLSSLAPIQVQKRWLTTTDGGRMLVWVVLPPNFDESKQYPALLYCQGGPQSTVSQFFSYRWNLRLMAEQGYVVIAPNRHGVPGFGKAWNEQISGDYSGQNIRDYLTAVDEVKKEPWVDDKRIGAVGASYGGYSVFYLAGHHEGRFSALVAHAGIFNFDMQYLTTEEMWFANWDLGGAYWERDNKVAQRTYAHSPHHFVDKWDTPILITHGELDYRILADQGMAAFNAAQLRGIPSQLLTYPDENHWIIRPQNSLLWHRTFYGWLDKWLKPQGK